VNDAAELAGVEVGVEERSDGVEEGSDGVATTVRVRLFAEYGR
jgi:hypothetical protein